jgi:hypothetical protein
MHGTHGTSHTWRLPTPCPMPCVRAASWPRRVQAVSWDPRVFIYRGFLSPEETLHIRTVAAPQARLGEEGGEGGRPGSQVHPHTPRDCSPPHTSPFPSASPPTPLHQWPTAHASSHPPTYDVVADAAVHGGGVGRGVGDGQHPHVLLVLHQARAHTRVLCATTCTWLCARGRLCVLHVCLGGRRVRACSCGRVCRVQPSSCALGDGGERAGRRRRHLTCGRTASTAQRQVRLGLAGPAHGGRATWPCGRACMRLWLRGRAGARAWLVRPSECCAGQGMGWLGLTRTPVRLLTRSACGSWPYPQAAARPGDQRGDGPCGGVDQTACSAPGGPAGANRGGAPTELTNPHRGTWTPGGYLSS